MNEELIMPGAVEVKLGEFRLIPGPKGDPGERGPRGYGIKSAVLNPDYTLTLNFEDGSSYTTPPIRGEDGAGVEDVRITPGEHEMQPWDTLTVELTDGRRFEFEIYNGAVKYCGMARDAAERARAAQRAIEDMSVSASSLPAGSRAEVSKSTVNGVTRLDFGIPRGDQGAVGPRGPQGIQGPEGEQGPPGESGVVTPASGWFTLAGDADGNLWACYNDSDTPPKFEVDASGNIYYITPDAA